MQASLSRSNPRRFCFLFFWGYTSNVTTIKFPGFYPKQTFVSALSFPLTLCRSFSRTVSIFEHLLLRIKGQPILCVKDQVVNMFGLGGHTISVVPPRLCYCVPKAAKENVMSVALCQFNFLYEKRRWATFGLGALIYCAPRSGYAIVTKITCTGS